MSGNDEKPEELSTEERIEMLMREVRDGREHTERKWKVGIFDKFYIGLGFFYIMLAMFLQSIAWLVAAPVFIILGTVRRKPVEREPIATLRYIGMRDTLDLARDEYLTNLATSKYCNICKRRVDDIDWYEEHEVCMTCYNGNSQKYPIFCVRTQTEIFNPFEDDDDIDDWRPLS